MKKLFKQKLWKPLDISEIYKDKTIPHCVFPWKKQETSEVDKVCKFVSRAHTMKFKGQVNGDPMCKLMDTGASWYCIY
jgi:hypothetical protein